MTGARRIDLDAIAAADAAEHEEIAEPVLFSFKGREFSLPSELEVGVSVYQVEAFQAKQEADAAEAEGRKDDAREANSRANVATVAAMRCLLGDSFDEFIALRPKNREMRLLIGEAVKLYGTTEGESSASASPSDPTGELSRPTSSGTTD